MSTKIDNLWLWNHGRQWLMSNIFQIWSVPTSALHRLQAYLWLVGVLYFHWFRWSTNQRHWNKTVDVMVRNLAQLGEAAKRHFYISHYAPYLPPPTFCTSIVFKFSWDGCDTQETFMWSSDPRKCLAACRTKAVPSFLSYFKTRFQTWWWSCHKTQHSCLHWHANKGLY